MLACVQGSQRELLNLSQQDYANRIEELNQSLKEAWSSDQKVKALKIVIQVGEQLSRTLSSPSSLHHQHRPAQCSPVRQAPVRHVRDPVLPQQVCPHHRHPRHVRCVDQLLSLDENRIGFLIGSCFTSQADLCLKGSGPCVLTRDLCLVRRLLIET